MKIIWTQNSLERLAQRGISKTEVKRTLALPDHAHRKEQNIHAKRRLLDNNILIVIYSETPESYKINTSFKIHKPCP